MNNLKEIQKNKNLKLILKYFIHENYAYFIMLISSIIMLSSFIDNIHFIDEVDNFLGGIVIADGGVLFKDYYAHHMPLLYYLFSIPALLGVNTINGFTIFFYLYLIILWSLIYFKYSKIYGKIPMALLPIIYITTMNFYETAGNAAISDHFQAQGFIILLFEYLSFIKTNDISKSSAIMISLSIVLTFGSTFTSILPVFVIFLGVVLKEITNLVSNEKPKCFISIYNYIIKKYAFLLIVCAAPFVILIIHYIINYNLTRFIYSVYTFNVDIYSNYQITGSDIFNDIISTVGKYASFIIYNINALSTNIIMSLRYLSYVVVNILFINYSYKSYKNYKYHILIVILFILMTGIRGFSGFHSYGYFAITIAMGVILINYHFIESKDKLNLRKKYIAIALIFCTTIEFIPMISKIQLITPDLINSELNESALTDIVESITDIDDKVIVTNLDTTLHISANRLNGAEYVHPASLPWLWDGFGSEIINELKSDPPKLVIYDPNYEIWGYKLIDTSPDLVKFIEENYTNPLSNYPTLYIYNSYIGIQSHINDTEIISELIYSDTVISQEFIANQNNLYCVLIKFGTYSRVNQGIISMKLLDEYNNVIREVNVNAIDLKDNEDYIFHFEPIVDSKSNTYKIEITNTGDVDNGVGIWMGEEDVNFIGNSYYNNKIIDGKWNLTLLYKRN